MVRRMWKKRAKRYYKRGRNITVPERKINIIHGDCFSANFNEFDTIIYDPPYSTEFYEKIPQCTNKQSLVLFSNPVLIADAIVCAVKKGYFFSYMITWDCIASWYIPGRILMRSNLIAVFSYNKYNEKNAIVYDGVKRGGRQTHNSRGVYYSGVHSYTKLSSVYSKMRSRMNKVHPHEKPIELVCGILKSIDAHRVIDCFSGSGACAIAGELAGADFCVSYEIDDNNYTIASESVNAFYGKQQFIGELFT